MDLSPTEQCSNLGFLRFKNGCVSACRALLSSSYCKDIINLLDNTGKCPLHFAAIIGHLDCVFEIGQGSGCNTETKDRDGRYFK